MKEIEKLIIIFAFIAIGTVGGTAGAWVEWLGGEVHDFGAFREADGGVTASFKFVNAGDAPLVITGARANCGCTTPVYPETAIEPGDTSMIQVTYDPAGRPGRFSKKVYIDTNTEPSRTVLTIRGTVIGAPSSIAGRYPVDAGLLRLAHPAALLGTVVKGHIKSVFEGAYNTSTDTLAPYVTGAPQWLEVKTVPERVAPGEQVSFNFFVQADKIDSWDIVTDTVTIVPDAGSEGSYRMPVVVTVKESFPELTDRAIAEAPVASVSLSTGSMLNLGKDPGIVTVSNKGKTPLIVRRLYSADQAVVISPDADGRVIKPGKKLDFTITAEETGGGNARRAVILLVSNDPMNPKISIPCIID